MGGAAVAANEDFVFIFEFKFGKTKEVASNQIKKRDYYRRYMNSGKRIFLVWGHFNMERGQIAGWISKEV